MTPAQFILAFWMLVTGSINTISTKYADMQCVPNYRLDNPAESCPAVSNSTNPDELCPPGCATFDHPFAQAAGMFLGEMLCLFVFKAMFLFRTPDPDENLHFPKYVFAWPAFLDMAGTSVMYLGLTMTYASVFQMLRGSVVVFTGMLSVVVLRRTLLPFHWVGMLLVTAGAAVVGVSALQDDGQSSEPKPSNPLLGNILIITAQVVVAVQMVSEELIFARHKRISGLHAVGLEGTFGLFYLSIALVAMYHIPRGYDICDGGPCIENALHAFREVLGNKLLLAAVLGNVTSIAFFNFFGISVTQSMSATHRMVLDSLRTMVIWGFSLLAKWQDFNYLQVVGFVILLAGTLLYNEIISVRCLGSTVAECEEAMGDEDVREPLLSDDMQDP
mmetsp:Transcript_30762/g.73912  ORF Transcript_30762/g.73912 Transcript_30762/m.73912 type:complete len:388 (-) Transcript_30762:352-1515(-)